MTLEVRELIIRATVVQEQEGAGAGGGATSGSNNDISPNEEMISACVEKILEILKTKNDR